jgi:uncharacterized protein with NRDE domain
MCLILFALSRHPEYPLVLAANRDEFYSRPARPLSFWEDAPGVLAGRDLKNMGTWLGINASGAFAAVTNHRDPSLARPDAPSRGYLVSNFLTGRFTPPDYLEHVRRTGRDYNGFNLLVGDGKGIFYYSNRKDNILKLDHGIYGLSNDILDTPWPKVRKGKKGLSAILEDGCDINSERIFSLLRDDVYAPDKDLPNTGVGDVWERILSPLFVGSRIYGTRCSSIILMEKTGRVTVYERTFNRVDDRVVEGETVCRIIEAGTG